MSLNRQLVAWTPELVERCRIWWEEDGLSAREIAALIGHGATKNTVIGKAHRCGWRPHKTSNTGWFNGKRVRRAGSQVRPRREKPAKPPKSVTRASKPKPAPPPARAHTPRPVALPAARPGRVTLLDLEPGQCKWPMNAPPRGGEYLFCAQTPTFGDSPYCEYHNRVGYQKGTAPRRPGLGAWVPRPVEA